MAIPSGEFVRRLGAVLEHYEAISTESTSKSDDLTKVFQRITELTEQNVEGLDSASSSEKTTLERLQVRMSRFSGLDHPIGYQLVFLSLRPSAYNNFRDRFFHHFRKISAYVF